MSDRRLLLHVPILIFIVVWASVIPLYYFNPYNFPRLDFNSWLVISSGILALITGYYIQHIIYLPPKLTIMAQSYEAVVFDEQKFAKLTILLSLIPLMGVLFAVKIIADLLGGMENYFLRPVFARHMIVEYQRGTLTNWTFAFSFSNYMMSVGYLTSILGGIAFTFKSKAHWAGIFPLLIGLVSSLVFIKRYAFIQSASFWMLGFLFVLFFADITNRQMLKKRFFRIMLVMFLVFTGFIILVIMYRATKENKILDFIVESIYSYYVGGVGAFNNLIHANEPLTYGLTTFRSIFKWLSRLHLWELEKIVGAQLEFSKVGSQYLNTYTYAYSFYRDFGFIGNMIMSFVFGLITRFSVEKLFIRFSLLRLFWVVAFTFTFIMSFYSFFLDSFSSILLYAIILVFIQKYFITHSIYISPDPKVSQGEPKSDSTQGLRLERS